MEWCLSSVLLMLALASSPRVAAGLPSLEELIHRSDRISLAEVLDSRVEIPEGDLKKMVTITTLLIREDYRGEGPDRLEVTQLGGQNGLWERHVHGDAVFELGESAVVFLKCPAEQPSHCSLVGLKAGKLPLKETRDQGQRVVFQVADKSEQHSLESVVDEVRRVSRAEQQRGSADPRPSKGKQ